MGRILTLTRLVLLGLTALFNWALVFTLSLLITNGHVPGSLAISAGSVGALVLLACSPLGEGYFRSVNGLREPSKWERGRVEPVLQTVLCRVARLTVKPELFVSPDRFPNALAVGTRTIAVTEGLLRENLSDEEMEGILAHEIGHLVHGDTKILLVAAVLNCMGRFAVWAITALAGLLAVIGEFTANFEGMGFLIGLMVVLWAWCLRLCAWIFYKMVELSFLAVGRRGEYAADVYAARLGFGSGLTAFLARDLSEYRRTPSLMCKFCATHPPAAKRIQRIRQEVQAGRTA